jgi:ParB family chromosome partitioning protein
MVKLARVDNAKVGTEPHANVARARNDTFGLSADFPELTEIPLADILDNPHQPRKHFDEAAIAELSHSIATRGLLQPILVRKHETERGKYFLVAGERRLRACRLLDGKKTIFAIVTARENPEVLSVVENLQRSDLIATEMASAFDSLVKRGETLENVGKIAGLSASAVSRFIGILGLPSKILDEYPGYAESVSRSLLLELQDVKGEENRIELWELAKHGQLSREEIRSRAKRAKQEKSAAENDGKAEVTLHDMKKLQRTLNLIKTNVMALDGYREHLGSEHMDALLDLRKRIDVLLGANK